MGLYDQYSGYKRPGLDSMGLDYPSSAPDPVGFPSMPQAASQAVGAASSALPWVGAGLSAAGLLSSLYGGYKAQETQDSNYKDQVREFNRQKMIEDEQRKRDLAQHLLENQIGAKGMADSEEANRLAKYAGYYRQIGL